MLDFQRGYDRGNYGNAYESQDWDSWYAEQCDKVPPEVKHLNAYTAGLLLGFFSSYEIHEIGDSVLAETVAAYRADYNVDNEED